MSRQIQIRRGTAAEHENFTGAVGEITMDTTTNTIRVHDGETVGGTPLARQATIDAADYVIESWRSDDGTQWYRKYKSGWVEQGGIHNTPNLVFPVAFTTDKYFANAIPIMLESNAGNISICYGNKSNTGISFQIRWNGLASNNVERMWHACGY